MTGFTVKGKTNGPVTPGTSMLYELYLAPDGLDSGAARLPPTMLRTMPTLR
jgi:hypothetical protein